MSTIDPYAPLDQEILNLLTDKRYCVTTSSGYHYNEGLGDVVKGIKRLIARARVDELRQSKIIEFVTDPRNAAEATRGAHEKMAKMVPPPDPLTELFESMGVKVIDCTPKESKE